MTSNSIVTKIGLHKIIAPEKTQLLFSDGAALAKVAIDEALVESLIRGDSTIAILVPDYFPVFTEGDRASKIMAEFYIGLLEPTLEQMRDALFPDLRIQANKDKIFVVGERKDDPLDVVQDIFHTAWVTYAPFEKFLKERIKFGLLHEDGTYSIANYTEDGWLIRFIDDDRKHSAFCWLEGKFNKALDGMFSANLRCRDVFINGPRSAAVRALPESKP